MGQTHLWLKIGPIKVPRPPPGSNYHETGPRNPIFGVPGPFGAKWGNFDLGGGGPMYAIVYPDLGITVCAYAYVYAPITVCRLLGTTIRRRTALRSHFGSSKERRRTRSTLPPFLPLLAKHLGSLASSSPAGGGALQPAGVPAGAPEEVLHR